MRAMRVLLAFAALASAAFAATVGSPEPPLAADEVSAVQLAEWLRDRRADLLIVDTRSADAIDQDRLPGARPLAEVAVAAHADALTVVVYAQRAVDARLVDLLRRQSDKHRYLRLRGGTIAWNAEVLFPVVRTDAPIGQQQAFAARAQLSRYFGGTPRQWDAATAPTRSRSRRGC